MPKNPTFLFVVAARIEAGDGRFLLQQAAAGKAHAGLWEFPGGKVESGESARAALVRELREELGLALDEGALSPAGFVDQDGHGSGPPLVLFLYTCTRWSGAPAALEGQAWGWFTAAEASELPLAELDRVLLTGHGGIR